MILLYLYIKLSNLHIYLFPIHPGRSTTAVCRSEYPACVCPARIYMRRKDKQTFLWRSLYFRGAYESLWAIFSQQTWLENQCKFLKNWL